MSPKTPRRPEELLPLRPPVFHVLLALADGPKHGYRILKEIEDHADGQVRLGPATLYDTIHRLRKEGLVEDCPAPAGEDDPRRRHYRLTGLGRKVAAAEVRRLADLLALSQAKRLLAGRA